MSVSRIPGRRRPGNGRHACPAAGSGRWDRVGAVAEGGLGYVYAADIVLAAEGTVFSTAFSGIGISGDGGGTWHLPRLVGAARARRMYLENLRLDAARALEWGLVAEVVPADELDKRARALADRLAAGPTRAYALQRRLLRESWDNTLSDQLRAIRESVSAIAERFGQAYFLERGRSGGHIDELWTELGKAGLLGVHLPEEYGGGGGGMTEAVVVVEELAAHGMPMLIWVISPAICGSILAAHASEAMKLQWLPDLADGSHKMAFGITEPDAGSNSHEIKTTARRDGDGTAATAWRWSTACRSCGS